MYEVLVLNVDELWLKGGNRKLYFKAFKNHVKKILKAFHPESVQTKNENQRLVVNSEIPFEEATLDALLKIPGLHSILPSRSIEQEFDLILPSVVEDLKSMKVLPKTFKVKAQRNDKTFPKKSDEINRYLGHQLHEIFPEMKVDVHRPELMVDIRIYREKIYISTQKLMGIGGQPMGMSGHLITLISGGFDSPVASYLMSKRGCTQTFAFFYAYPFVGEEVKDKILDLVKVLGRYQFGCRLFVIPFGDIQNLISKSCREEYRTILFRKYMVECANLLARRVKAKALLTGDALGQVSSQTLGNMSIVDKTSERPILRPLTGFNKVEIINLSRQIGTHDVSVIPHDDACSLFAPKHPILKPDYKYWNDFISSHNFNNELNECLDKAEVFSVDVKGEISTFAPKV